VSQAIALRWLSARTLQAVQQVAYDAAAAWARAWGLDAPGQLAVQAVATWPAADTVGLNLAVDDTPPDSWTQALTRTLFAGDAGGSTLAAAVVADATGQLRSALRKALGLADDQAASDATAATPGHAGVLVQLDILACTAWARVPHAALSHCGLLSRPKPAPVPRWNAEQSLAATPVPVHAVLGHVPVDVLDVLNLAHGDVLLLPHTGLDAAVLVQGIGTPLQLQARLGAIDGNRAVQWQAGTRSTH
jgi:hypothetical protein